METYFQRLSVWAGCHSLKQPLTFVTHWAYAFYTAHSASADAYPVQVFCRVFVCMCAYVYLYTEWSLKAHTVMLWGADSNLCFTWSISVHSLSQPHTRTQTRGWRHVLYRRRNDVRARYTGRKTEDVWMTCSSSSHPWYRSACLTGRRSDTTDTQTLAHTMRGFFCYPSYPQPPQIWKSKRPFPNL